VRPLGSAVILAILLRVSTISEEQEGQEEKDDLRMGGQWRKTPRYAGQQGDPVPRGYKELYGERKA
jgi:hypothetical protein